ncbi:MAG: ABC transporter permease [Labrys sp. (in: a-proteobacteria)]
MVQPFADLVRYHELIRAVLSRELSVRFKSSAFGWIWAIFAPLVMLAAYTVVFSHAIKLDTQQSATGQVPYAFSIFCGLIVFNFFAEIAVRSPLLLAESKHLIRRSIFPAQVLAWIAMGRAFVYMLIATGVLLVGRIVIGWTIDPLWLMIPVVFLPLALTMVGVSWVLSTIGALTSDLSHLIIAIMPVFMIVSPVFFEMTDVPADAAFWLYLNPLATFAEMLRDVALRGTMPSPVMLVGSYVAGLVILWLGHSLFMRKKMILVDII